MNYSHEVEQMCMVKKGPNHGPAPIPQEGLWTKAYEIKDISAFTHGVGWCAPQQGACKLTLNVKEGIIQEALVETIGCSGMTHSAAMAAEIEALGIGHCAVVCDGVVIAVDDADGPLKCIRRAGIYMKRLRFARLVNWLCRVLLGRPGKPPVPIVMATTRPLSLEEMKAAQKAGIRLCH